jgi:radical SAM protein with 4Fe4S-binding SPASM domain
MDQLNYILMPNGDMFYCCMTRGLSNKVGNMEESTFSELAARHKETGEKMSRDINSICHICPSSCNYHINRVKKLKDKILSGRTIEGILFRGTK